MINRTICEVSILNRLFRISLCILVSFRGWMIGPLEGQNYFNTFKVDHWDTRNGLPNDLILNMYQSKDGYLWLTSFAGLTRFDGIDFTTFNSKTVPVMKSDNVELVYESQDSTLWIPAQSKGLISFKQGVFNKYSPEITFSRIIGTTAENELLFYTGNPGDPFLLFNSQSKTGTVLQDSTVTQMYIAGKIVKANSRDRSGDQWRIVTGKLLRIHSGKLFALSEKEGIRQGFLFHDPYVDSQNRLWLPTNENLQLWNGTRMETYPGMENKAFFVFANTRAGLIMEDKQGGIWAAYSGGLAYLAPGARHFVFVPENHPLHDVNITYLLEDREGSVWASSENGLFKLSQSKFKNYSEQEGLSNNRVAAVCALDTQQYLVATSRDGRLFHINHGQVIPFQYKNAEYNRVKDEVIHIYQDYRKDIWICGLRQTIRISGNKEKRMMLNSGVRFVYEDKNKKLWFGLPFRGIAFLNDKDELEMANFPNVDFKNLFITSILKLKQDYWLVTTANKGVLLINPQGEPRIYNDSFGLATNVIYNGYEESEGTCWITTNLGIFRFKLDSFIQVKFSEGLSENALFAYLPDQLGNVWFPSNRGIVRVRKQDLTDHFEGKIKSVDWRLFDDEDGMRNRQGTGARFSAISPDGRLLIPTMGGLVEIDPGQIPENRIPPSVVIHRILRDGISVDLTQNHSFEPGNHRFLFEFSGLSLVAPQKVQFKYKLIGYDKEWINSNVDRRAFYTNIPHGKFTFQVIASNNDGFWNETGARFEFNVLPFYYETTWFRALVLFTLFLLLWFVVRWRTASTRKQNELLEAQVAARTLELNKVNGDLNQTNAAIATQRDNLEKTLHELKTTQAQLIQSEKMASLGEMAAGIAHEIQNPLNFVNNFSEINTDLLNELKSQRAKGTEQRDELAETEVLNDIEENEKKINHHGKRADAIVKSMLQHARVNSAEASQKELTDINKLADEYLRLAYQGYRAKDKDFNCTLQLDLDPKLPLVSVIPQDLGRVLLNLYNNAFWFLSEASAKDMALGDRTTLAGLNPGMPGVNLPGFEYSPTISLTTKNLNNKSDSHRIEIRVRDNGPGIPQHVLDKIFQPFFTTKPTGQGTGLGLSLAYDIIKAHQGELIVENPEGGGACFVIRLPIEEVKSVR